MRICPGCRAIYDRNARTCAKDGLKLIDYGPSLEGASLARGLPTPAPPLFADSDLSGVKTPSQPSVNAALVGDATVSAGMMVGDYRVERVIAHGGIGVVYAATHPVISKRVAIKVLSRRFARDPEQIARFVLEARAVNQIGHHNIVDIFAIGELTDGRKYLVMEYLDGVELHRILSRVGRFKPGEVLPIYEQLCDALSEAHAKGFVHRDLKPENVTVLRRHPYPFVKILDFGIAKLRGTQHTAVGTVLGTPEYMAPEQCSAKPIDARVDIYALGIMLYEFVTGVKPFTGVGPLLILQRQTHEKPRPPRESVPISEQLNALILKAIEKDPAQRHQSVNELIRELRRAVPQALPWTTSLEPALGLQDEQTKQVPAAAAEDDEPTQPASLRGADSDGIQVADRTALTPLSGIHAGLLIDDVKMEIEPLRGTPAGLGPRSTCAYGQQPASPSPRASSASGVVEVSMPDKASKRPADVATPTGPTVISPEEDTLSARQRDSGPESRTTRHTPTTIDLHPLGRLHGALEAGGEPDQEKTTVDGGPFADGRHATTEAMIGQSDSRLLEAMAAAAKPMPWQLRTEDTEPELQLIESADLLRIDQSGSSTHIRLADVPSEELEQRITIPASQPSQQSLAAAEAMAAHASFKPYETTYQVHGRSVSAFGLTVIVAGLVVIGLVLSLAGLLLWSH